MNFGCQPQTDGVKAAVLPGNEAVRAPEIAPPARQPGAGHCNNRHRLKPFLNSSSSLNFPRFFEDEDEQEGSQ